MDIDAQTLHFKELNTQIRKEGPDIVLNGCTGQRFIGSGLADKNITINGIPGNAMGAYLDGAALTVNGNAQDAVGDTMNEGRIIIKGDAGDALGYAMRGGKIYIKGNSGYRTGIHIKEYKHKKPVIIVGEHAGSFLGEYMAGGIIIVLGLSDNGPVTGTFTGTGMHGGKIFIRSEYPPEDLPKQVVLAGACEGDMLEIKDYLKEYSDIFDIDYDFLVNGKFHVLKPDTKNPYKQMYVAN